MSLFEDKVMEAVHKIAAAHETEKQELLNDLFDMGKRSEQVHRENLRLRQALKEIANTVDHPSMDEAIRGEMGEYKRGWYSCWKSLSERAQKALEP
jgi:hypothetical protein